MVDRIKVLREKPGRALVERLTLLIEEVVGKLDEGQDCASEIAEINRLSGGASYTSETFFELYSHTSEANFAEVAAKGPAPLLEQLSRAELIEIIELISDPSEPVEYFIDVLDRSLPGRWSSDLVFWPDAERSPTELADYLLSGKEQ